MRGPSHVSSSSGASLVVLGSSRAEGRTRAVSRELSRVEATLAIAATLPSTPPETLSAVVRAAPST